MATRERGLLTNREYNVKTNAIRVKNFLKELKGVNVVHVEYLEQTSSAGDWSGLFIQKYNKKSYVIGFSQENKWPNMAFTLYTGDSVVIVNGDIDRRGDEWNEIKNNLCDMWYGC